VPATVCWVARADATHGVSVHCSQQQQHQSSSSTPAKGRVAPCASLSARPTQFQNKLQLVQILAKSPLLSKVTVYNAQPLRSSVPRTLLCLQELNMSGLPWQPSWHDVTVLPFASSTLPQVTPGSIYIRSIALTLCSLLPVPLTVHLFPRIPPLRCNLQAIPAGAAGVIRSC
jgi:hypothetical protein